MDSAPLWTREAPLYNDSRVNDSEDRLRLLESEIERRLLERFAALRDEFDRLRLESDRRWAGFLSRFDQDFTGIVPPELIQPPAPPPPTAAPGLLSIEAVRHLDEAVNQVETLHSFLDLCRRHASRVALFVARSGALGVWKAVGFSDHGGSDELVRRVTLPIAEGGPLARVMEGTPCRLTKDNEISELLGSSNAAQAVLIPMVVREKISGAVYADGAVGEEERFDPESIGLLTFFAGLVVDRLASRKLKPAPALRSPEVILAAPPSEIRETYGTQMMSLPLPEPGETAAPQPPPSFFRAPVEEPQELPEERTPPSSSASLRVGPALEDQSDSTAPGVTMRIPLEPVEPPPAEAPKPPEPLPPSVPGRPSSGARRLAGPLAQVEGDERREEARRFAKLLVSEIKLYNERAVQQGREQGNLYDRLKEDIDRSRQMYEERIPEDVRASSNFFYEELVRILADGRADVLGM